MKRTGMIKAIALGISATLLFQPIAVYAEGEYNEDVVAAIDNAEEKVDAAINVVEPVVETPAAEQPAEPVEPQVIKQEETDEHLGNAGDALQNIEKRVEEYNEVLENSEEGIAAADAAYEQAVTKAEGSEETFEQKAEEAAAASFPTIIETGKDAYEAHQDANQVVEAASYDYEFQYEAEAAKAEAQLVAQAAQTAATDAQNKADELGKKVEAAEQAKEQADADFQAAEGAYWDAVLARQDAEIEYNKIVRQYGLDNWFYNPDAPFEFWGNYGNGDVRTAIVEARAALDSAKDYEKDAKDDYDDAKDAFDEADGVYQQALLDKEDAEGKLDDAEQALADAKRALDKANLIVAVNDAEAAEISTYNDSVDPYIWWWLRPSEEEVAEKDMALAQGLIKYQLFDEVDDIEAVDIQEVDGKIVVTYSKEVDGETVEITRRFTYTTQNEQNIHGHKDSAHWLVLSEVTSEERHRDKVVGQETYYVDHLHNGKEVSFNPDDYADTTKYLTETNYNGKITVWTVDRYGRKKDKVISVYPKTRDITEDETYYEDVETEFYKEADFYRANKDFTNAQAQADYNKADKDKKDLDDAIAKPGLLEEDWNNKSQALEDAEAAQAAAGTKLGAVEEALKAVTAAAKKLKELEQAEKVNYTALTVVKNQYYTAVAELQMAEFAYQWAAFNAGIAQDEADRALAALEDGFNYRIPNPTPGPSNPSEEPGGPSETPTTEPTYVASTTAAPVAPVAEPAAVLGETRARSNGNGARVEEDGNGGEEIKEAPVVAGEKKQEEKIEEKKPVSIDDEDTARAAAPIETKKGFPWWILIIIAIIIAVSIEEYQRRKNKAENQIQE